MVNLNDAYEIARYIKEVEKKTPVKVYVNTDPYNFESTDDYKVFGTDSSHIFIGDYDAIMAALNQREDCIRDIHVEYDRRNSAIPLKILFTSQQE